MQKIVLITGASSGIGYDAVRALIADGYRVVASVRKKEDRERLLKVFPKNLDVILLDITNFSEVDKLPEILKYELKIEKIFGLVNNAGIALAGPFEHQDFNEIQSIIQVNLVALLKVTQVLLPMITDRIINMSSIAGKSATPFLSIYGAAKHGVEGFSEALRKELYIKGIKVVMIAPGSIQTPIWEKGFGVIKDKYKHTIYGEAFERFMKFAAIEVSYALPVSAVSECVLDALNSANPKVRYAPIPAKRKWVNWYLPKLIPTKIYDRLTAKALKLTK